MSELVPNKTFIIVQNLINKYQEITGNSLVGDEMKVHKLMFYAQKTSLALTGETIIDENFEGWVHGPVLPSLRGIFDFFIEEPEYAYKVNETEKYIIENTIYKYGQYATWALRNKSHEETSWKKSRTDLKENEKGQNKIQVHDIFEDAKNLKIYDFQYDMYLDDFEDIDEEDFVSVY